MADLMTVMTCSTAEAAEALNMSPAGVVELINAGGALKAERLGGQWRIEVEGVLVIKKALGL